MNRRLFLGAAAASVATFPGLANAAADEGSLNTVRGVGKRVAEIALRMAASAK